MNIVFVAPLLAALSLMNSGVSAAHRTSTPAVSSIAPNLVGVGASTVTVTVRGSGFTRNAVVRWQNADRPTTYVSDTELRATISATDLTTVGTFQIVVNVPGGQGGTSNPATFTVAHPAPAFTGLTPSTAMAGGEPFTLTVDGAQFVQGAAIRWNGSARPTTYVSATRLSAQITTADLLPGAAAITVTNPSPAVGPSAARTLTVTLQTPGIATLSPANMTEDAAAFVLTVTGQNFVRASTIRWNNSARTTTFVSPTQLRATIGSTDIANPGVAAVTVVTQLGNISATSPASSFTIELAPQRMITGTITVAQPVTTTPRLGEQRLPERGSFFNTAPASGPYGSVFESTTIDCKARGANYVMIGISGRHGWGVDFINVICAPVNPNGTLGTATSLTGVGGSGGSAFPERRCSAGKVVAGIRGTSSPDSPYQLRSLELQCQTMGAGGLVSGGAAWLPLVGTAKTNRWGDDVCAGGRSARALRVHHDVWRDPFIPLTLAPKVIGGVQMICEQPQV